MVVVVGCPWGKLGITVRHDLHSVLVTSDLGKFTEVQYS